MLGAGHGMTLSVRSGMAMRHAVRWQLQVATGMNTYGQPCRPNENCCLPRPQTYWSSNGPSHEVQFVGRLALEFYRSTAVVDRELASEATRELFFGEDNLVGKTQ